MSKSLGKFSGEPRQRIIDLEHATIYVDGPSRRAKAPRGEGLVVAFEYLAAALLALWLVGVTVGALDQMLASNPTVILGPDGEPWP